MYSQERFAGEIRTVPMASFPTFSVTENKPLLFLQQSLAYYLAIQWIKKPHKNFSRNTCVRFAGIGTAEFAHISESLRYWFSYWLIHKACMNQHFSSCVLAPANIVKVTLEIRKALISNSSHVRSLPQTRFKNSSCRHVDQILYHECFSIMSEKKSAKEEGIKYFYF